MRRAVYHSVDGLYVYDARPHQLNSVLRANVRARTGIQSYVQDAPLNLVYVADLAKTGPSSTERDLYVTADVGFIAHDVYLFYASKGLATVVRGSLDRPALSAIMRLRPNQHINLAQAVGYPRP